MVRPIAMLVLLLLWGLLTTLGCVSAMPEAVAVVPTERPDDAVVRIGNASYTVDLAVLPEERQQGLSGREHMDQDSGMLFVFDEEQQLYFWMKEMHFPLDIIWIDAQCRLLEVAENVPIPPPGASNDEIPRAQSPSPAKYVLEVRAGETARNGLAAGDVVEFRGSIAGQHGC